VKANWKLIAENFMEYYHLPTIHPELVRVSKVNLHYRYQGNGMYMGFCTSPLTDDPQSPFELIPPMPGLNEKEAKSAMWIHIFPNISLFLLPNHLFTLLLNPRGTGETLEFTDLLAHPSVRETEKHEEYLQDIFTYWDRVNRQDFEAVQRVQLGITSRAYPGGRMCERFEEPLHRFQNMIIDRMVSKDRIPEGDKEVSDSYFLSQNLKMENSNVLHS
jgi:choline monooxygenase